MGFIQHRTETDRSDLLTGVSVGDTTRSDNLTWHVGLGAAYRFADRRSAEAMYRYADLGDIDIGPFSTGDSVSYDDAFSHEFVFGIAYHFGQF